MVAAAVVGAGIGGALISSSASKSSANTMKDAANRSADIQNAQWQQTQGNMKPYMQLGQSSINPLLKQMGYNTSQNQDGTYNFDGIDSSNPLMQRFQAPTADQAAQTPGYQFTLDQGLKSTQNSAAARGLGTSGAALKGAAGYSTGLANSTYNDVYNRALQTFNTNYSSAANTVNRLQTLVGSGQNAAGGMGALGAQTMGNIGNSLTSAANASAAGTVGSANALTNALSGMGNNAMLYGMMQNNAGGPAYNAAAARSAYSNSQAAGYSGVPDLTAGEMSMPSINLPSFGS